jgi:dihydroxyacetone kinase-like protein
MNKVKKILNDPRRAVEEMVEGLMLANDGRVRKLEGHPALIRVRMSGGTRGVDKN